ncbi:MAG: hypothetical protein AAFV80_22090, partial [Bacteroidota bacterium]
MDGDLYRISRQYKSNLKKNIFLSYRRKDSEDSSGRLFDHLNNAFPNCVFLDINNIDPGDDFKEAIRTFLEKAD